MGKSSRRAARNDFRSGLLSIDDMEQGRVERKRATTKPLEAKTENQRRYISMIGANIITFGLGPIGTGKTYIAASLAAEAFRAGEVKKIIITRPALEAGESLGFLPGELEDKFGPYFEPVRQVLEERLGSGPLDAAVEAGKIVVLPLAYMRGHTFKDAFVLLDEAQNTTPKQMYMFLTRIGEYAKVVIDGDLNQIDLPHGARSGLRDAIEKLRGVKSVGVIEFDSDDIVRSGIAREIAVRYSCDERNTHDSSFQDGNTPGFLKS